MSTLKVNAIQNSSGVEQYLCKAWVNFNGTGTVAIRAAGNVSSITDVGTGDYRVNFANAMPDANYATLTTTSHNIGVSQGFGSFNTNDQTTTQTSILRVITPAGANYDSPIVNFAIFR